MTTQHHPIAVAARLSRLAAFLLVIGLIATAIGVELRTGTGPGASPAATDSLVDWGD